MFLPRLLAVALLALSAVQAIAAVPYNGVGGQAEAGGTIAGTYVTTVAILEGCEKVPELKEQAEKARREYVQRNQPICDEVMRKLTALAKASGGDAEVARLKSDHEKGTALLSKQGAETATLLTPSATRTAAFLDKVNKGTFDIKVKHSAELAKILE
jgi:hypothetical protein